MHSNTADEGSYHGWAILVSLDYSRAYTVVLRVGELTGSNDPFGSFRPLVPSFMRLVAGIIVLIVVESIVLGFPGLTQTVPSSTVTISSLIIFLVGFVATVLVFKYGTQLSAAAADTYDSVKNYQELLTWVFQIAALYIFYTTSRALVTASGIFRTTPWAYPMIFVAIGLIPTIKIILNAIHRVEGRHT